MHDVDVDPQRFTGPIGNGHPVGRAARHEDALVTIDTSTLPHDHRIAANAGISSGVPMTRVRSRSRSA